MLSDKEYIDIWSDLNSQNEAAAIAALDRLASNPGLLAALVNQLTGIGEKRVSEIDFSLAIGKLAKRDNPNIKGKLHQCLSSNDDNVKFYVALGLVDTCFVESILTLMPLTPSRNEVQRGLVVDKLSLTIDDNLSNSLDFQVRLQLINYLCAACTDVHDVRRWAISTLSSTDLLVGFERFDKFDGYFVMLWNMAEDNDVTVRCDALEGLGLLGERLRSISESQIYIKNIDELLVKQFSDKESAVRAQAVSSLQKMGSPKALDIALQALQDESTSVRLSGLGALRFNHTFTPRAIRALKSYQPKSQDPSEQNVAKSMNKVGGIRKLLAWLPLI